jgi:hypothetical protein
MSTIEAIKREAERRGITRLCHFTPSRNLVHILTGETGILATQSLQTSDSSVFTSTDPNRLDRHEKYICCSIEYPNVFYFNLAQSKDKLFKDWALLFIDSKYLWLSGTRFSPVNAATGSGRYISEGEKAFLEMFAPSVEGARGNVFSRGSKHLISCPTDNQAEVLLPDRIAMEDILAIAVPTQEQAKNEIARLRWVGKSENRFQFVVAPDLFDKNKLPNSIRNGKRPIEIFFESEE